MSFSFHSHQRRSATVFRPACDLELEVNERLTQTGSVPNQSDQERKHSTLQRRVGSGERVAHLYLARARETMHEDRAAEHHPLKHPDGTPFGGANQRNEHRLALAPIVRSKQDPTQARQLKEPDSTQRALHGSELRGIALAARLAPKAMSDQERAVICAP